MDPYKDKAILYELYVKKRMGIKDMAEYFKKNYNCKVTPQTIYNWLEKYDLLKFRGKGRKINISRGQKSNGAGRNGVYGTGMKQTKPKPPWVR